MKEKKEKVKEEKIKKEKPKKEKKIKEKKSENGTEKKKNKLLSKLIGILAVIAILLIGINILPMILGGKLTPEKTYESGILVEYNKNLFFNKYDIIVKFDGADVGTLKQGDNFGYVSELSSGTYIVTFTDATDSTNKIDTILTVVDGENCASKFDVKANWKGLEVTQSSVNIEKCKKIATNVETIEETREESSEEKAEDGESKEEDKKEEIKEEKTEDTKE